MALKLQKFKKEYEYVPVEFREEKNPPTFIFKPLKKEQKARLEDRLVLVNPDQTINVSNATYLLSAIKLALIDVKNVEDEDGNPIKVERKNGTITDEFLDMFPDDILQELGQVIISVSKDPKNADLYLGNINKEIEKSDAKK